MIRRGLSPSLTNSFFLFGARGTGKTTLLKAVLSDSQPLIIDLLKRDVYRELQANPEKLSAMIGNVKGTKRFVLIDEVQKVPELLELVHYHIETDRILFALTGSSSRKLKRGGANLLAGRAFVYKLYPLTVTELGSAFCLEDALRWGTLPYVITATQEVDRNRYLRAYVETYLTEEIVEEQIVRNLPPFSRFLSVAAQSTAKIVNYSSIARDIATDPSNVRNYFSILEETLLGFFLEPYHTSIRKRQRTAPKFYFYDTGIVRTLSKLIDIPLRRESKEFGVYFENFVITQIKAYLEYQEKQFQLSYFRTADNAEIDLVIERAGKETLLIEIKSATYCDPTTLHTLRSVSHDIPQSRAICLYEGADSLLVEGVEVLPWREIFEILSH